MNTETTVVQLQVLPGDNPTERIELIVTEMRKAGWQPLSVTNSMLASPNLYILFEREQAPQH